MSPSRTIPCRCARCSSVSRTRALPARAEMLDLIARFRHDYGLSADQLLKRLQPSIAGVTTADLERWRAASEVQWRMIDGRPAFFRAEPANVFRFCGEAKERQRRASS